MRVGIGTRRILMNWTGFEEEEKRVETEAGWRVGIATRLESNQVWQPRIERKPQPGSLVE